MDTKIMLWFSDIRLAIVESNLSDAEKLDAIDETFRLSELLRR